ncbi:MAG: DUF1289 domain-containing protein [Gemmobacter sp.]
MSSKTPSPCIDVCKYKRAGHCIACSMTEVQKKMFKSLEKPAHRAEFVEMVWHQQQRLGGFSHWLPAYQKLCGRKGAAWAPPVGKAEQEVDTAAE